MKHVKSHHWQDTRSFATGKPVLLFTPRFRSAGRPSVLYTTQQDWSTHQYTRLNFYTLAFLSGKILWQYRISVDARKRKIRVKRTWKGHCFFYFQLDTVQSKLKTRSVCGKKQTKKKKTSFLSFWSMLRDTLWLSNYSSWNGTRVIYLRFRRGFYRRCVYLLETSFVYKECRIIDTPSYHKHLVFLTGTDAGRTK